VQWQVQYKSTNTGSQWADVTSKNTLDRTNVQPSDRSKTITGLNANQNYQWHIRALCGKIWTSYSSSVTLKTPAAPKAMVTNNLKSAENWNSEARGLQVVAQPNPTITSFTLHIQSSSL